MFKKLRWFLVIGVLSTAGIACGFDSAPVSAATISMTTSGTQSISIIPDSSSNVGTKIGVDNINVVTDCQAGYNLSMSTSVSDNNLYLNGNSSNNQSGTYFSPANGISTLVNSPNTWGYLLSGTTPTSSSVFSAVPTSSNPAVLKTPATTSGATNINDSFNVYFGVAMSNSMTPGKYKMIPDTNNSNADGSITYYLTMDSSCEARTITYNANNGSGSISPQVVQGGTSVDLADNAFTRANYYFKGWSTNPNATTPEYRTNQAVTPTDDMTLYAIWGNSTTTTLYDVVASLTKGTQANDANTVANTGNTIAGIKATITKANSGVYTYDASTYGVSSDASNSNPIYYYRGILDTDLDGTSSTLGSNGNGMDYPNYVRLNDYCWRIIRTTGSGGVKMIYNGSYSGGTTANSCANSQTNAQFERKAINESSNINYKSIISAGYTFNSNYKTTTADTTIGELFGTESTYANNDTRSSIKTYLEDIWYARNMINWTSRLEASAGYCNDRSMYKQNRFATSEELSENTSIPTPYTTASSGITPYYFGAYARNSNSSQSPSLTCPYATRDLYRYSSGSSSTGNQLKYPAALPTADELSFAGSGNNTANFGSGYHPNSYLRTGFEYWLLSPAYRTSNGIVYEFNLTTNGYITTTNVSYNAGMRPVISLKSGTTIASGSGTATDPWVIDEPKTIADAVYMQDVTSEMVTYTEEYTTASLTDRRDNQVYTVVKINGDIWMTRNLAIGCNGNAGTYGGSVSSKNLTDELSNVSSSWSTPTTLLSSASSSTQTADYTTARMQCNSTYGAWYNYAAATAGTIIGTSNSTKSTYDICPAGWHIPSGPSTTNNTEFNRLVGNSTAGWQIANSSLTAFTGATGGRYVNGSRYDTGCGSWWQANSTDGSGRYYMSYNSSNDNFRGDDNYYRYIGAYVRCVRSS